VGAIATKANASAFEVRRVVWLLQGNQIQAPQDSPTLHVTVTTRTQALVLIGDHVTVTTRTQALVLIGDHGTVTTKPAPATTVLDNRGRDNRPEGSVMIGDQEKGLELHAKPVRLAQGSQVRAKIVLIGVHAMPTAQLLANRQAVATERQQLLLSKARQAVETALQVEVGQIVVAATTTTVAVEETVVVTITETQVLPLAGFVARRLRMPTYVLISGQLTPVCRVTNPTGVPTVVGTAVGSGATANASGWNSKTKTQKY